LNTTEAGQAYYRRCRQVLDDVDELEAAVRDQQAAPTGRLVVAAPTSFGELYLTRAVAAYLDEQPGVSVDLVLADRYVNIVDEGFDLAVRIGALEDSSLIARHLAPARIVTCASPAYLERAGRPAHPLELPAHSCIIDSNFRVPDTWRFQETGQPLGVRVSGRFQVNSALAVRECLLAGQGIGRCPAWAVAEDLGAGRLIAILEQFEALAYGIYAVYPHNRHLAAKVRSFVDFLARRFRLSRDLNHGGPL
jgi:DNA-binding transcriptional LysR family regulator